LLLGLLAVDSAVANGKRKRVPSPGWKWMEMFEMKFKYNSIHVYSGSFSESALADY